MSVHLTSNLLRYIYMSPEKPAYNGIALPDYSSIGLAEEWMALLLEHRSVLHDDWV